MRVYSLILDEGKTAKRIQYLLSKSIWFIVDPLPGGFFEISVKEEHKEFLCSRLIDLKIKDIATALKSR